MGNAHYYQVSERLPYPTLSPSALASVVSPAHRTRTQSAGCRHIHGYGFGHGRQYQELDEITIKNFSKSHPVESSFSFNSKTDISTNDNTNISTNRNIGINKENSTIFRKDIVTKMKRATERTVKESCRSCQSLEGNTCILESSDSFTKDNLPANVVPETNKNIRLVPTVCMRQLSEPCFEELTEADQATSRFFHDDSSSDDVLLERGCPIGCPFNKPVNHQLSSDVPGRSRRTIQSLEDNSSLEEADNVCFGNVDSVENAEDVCCMISDAYSKSFIRDPSMQQHTDLECGIVAQQYRGEPSDFIEITRHSVFFDARTGMRYAMVYGSLDLEDTGNSTNTEKTLPFHTHESLDSTNGLTTPDPDSSGSWPIFKLSPTEQASGRMSEYFHGAQCVHDTAPGHSQSLHGTTSVQVHSSSSTFHDDAQSFPCQVSEQIQPHSGTIPEQTRLCKNQPTDLASLSNSYPVISAFNIDPTCTSNTLFPISDHSNVMGHPLIPAHLRYSPEFHGNSDAIVPDSFATQPNLLCGSQPVQDRVRALYQKRRGFSVNDIDFNSVRTLTASHLMIDEHGNCLVCRRPAETKLSLRRIIPITSSSCTVTAANQTETINQTETTNQAETRNQTETTNQTETRNQTETIKTRGNYSQSLGTNKAITQPVERQKGRDFPQHFQTPDRQFPEVSCDWKIDPGTSATEALNSLKCPGNCFKTQGSRNRTVSCNSDCEKLMATRAKFDDCGKCGSMDVCSSSPREEERKEEMYRTPAAGSEGACGSVGQKNYLAYLCCAEDNLSLFGLPFHKMLEGWGMRIFLAERDLEPGCPKYETIAKCVAERCNGKIIVILSKSYAKSEDCVFLTNFAKTLDPDSKHKNIIPVVIDKNVEIPKILQGLSLIYYNYVFRNDWLKQKIISAISS